MPPNYSNMPPNLLSPKINTYLSPNCSKMSPIYCINWDYVTVSLEKVTTKCSLGHVCSFVTQLVRKFAAHFSWLNQSSQKASEWSIKWWQIWTQLHMCTSDNETRAEEVDEVDSGNEGKAVSFQNFAISKVLQRRWILFATIKHGVHGVLLLTNKLCLTVIRLTIVRGHLL